jgi:hypothetical protein
MQKFPKAEIQQNQSVFKTKNKGTNAIKSLCTYRQITIVVMAVYFVSTVNFIIIG